MHKIFQTLTIVLCLTQNLQARVNVWETTEYVWHFDLAQACDIGLNSSPVEFFEKEQDCYVFNPLPYKNIHRNDIVWVRCRFIPQFSKKILPHVQHPFTIVISAGDESFPSNIAERINIEEFIENDNIIHIFAQNCDYNGPSKKITRIPIGMDFHTIAYNGTNGGWGEKGSPRGQEEVMNQILSSLSPTSMRIPRAFVDFQHSDSMHGEFKRYLQFGEDRKSIFQKLLPTGLIDYADWMRRTDLWKTKGQYAFSISPHGNGLDCHRTWEALYMKAIPIISSSASDSMYEGLPVVIIKDWSVVTPAFLEEKLKELNQTPMCTEKLWTDYWFKQMDSFLR